MFQDNIIEFNKDWEIKLLVDSSIKFGIAYLLLQVDPEGNIHIICCGSCAVKKMWHSFSAVECEAVGICWAVNHCRFYLRGCPKFVIVTDHKPLVTLLTSGLENLSPKLFRYVTELLSYNYTVEWVPGKKHMAVNALGRIPQLESFKGFDPLAGGGESDWENGGKYGIWHSVNNTTHLDNTLGIQVTADVMRVVKEDLIYQRILKDLGNRSKLGLRQLPRDHPAQRLKPVWDSLGGAGYLMEKR